MKIWIDISTSPQVLFLRPIIVELQKRGFDLLVTTRHSTETVPLADRYNISHTVIGAHGGSTMTGKSAAIVFRAIKLMNFVRKHNISLALSHASFSQALAAGLMRIPMITFDDYEGNPATHILCRVAKKIYVPKLFNNENLFRYGATEEKVEKFDGLKENVYLADFIPDSSFLSNIGIPSNKIVVTMRPPNLVAAYHRFDNPLFDKLLYYVLEHPDIIVVLLPRGSEQRLKYKDLKLQNVLIPDQVLDGPDLIFHSDLVLGAGGTMNREATVLGTPVYTLFKGEMGSVDQNLIKMGKMFRIENEADFSNIKLCKKPNSNNFSMKKGQELVNDVILKIITNYQN